MFSPDLTPFICFYGEQWDNKCTHNKLSPFMEETIIGFAIFVREINMPAANQKCLYYCIRAANNYFELVFT